MKTTLLVFVLYFGSGKCGGEHSNEKQSSQDKGPAFMEIEHFQQSIDVVRVS